MRWVSESVLSHTRGTRASCPWEGTDLHIYTAGEEGWEGPYQHILRAVGLGRPVRDPPHATLSVAELLTEDPVLGLGVPAAVRVVESDVEEEGPVWGANAEVAAVTPHLAFPWEAPFCRSGHPWWLCLLPCP